MIKASPINPNLLIAPQSVFAVGTVYALTNTAAKLDFGTTDPTLVIPAPGVWLLLARVLLNYNGATFAAVRTATLKLRRTNNTAADVTNGSVALKTQIITTLTFSMPTAAWQVLYTTANSDDLLELWGSLDVVPTAGSLDAAEASIVACKVG